MSSTAIYWVPAACGCCACRREALGQSGERYGHCGGQCPEGLGGGWKKSPVFINRILSKALKGLFGYPGPGFSQAEAGQVGLQELVTSTLCMVPALRLDLQAWRRRGRMPTGTAASEKAKVKDQFPKWGAPWARRCCGETRRAASPLGGTKQPAVSVGRAKCGNSPPSVSSNCLGSQGSWYQGQHGQRDPEEYGINTGPGGPGLRSATTLVEVITGREPWVPGGRGKTHIRWAHALCGLCRRRGGAPAPLPENGTISVALPGLLCIREHRYESLALQGKTYFQGKSGFMVQNATPAGPIQMRSDFFQ